MLHLAGLAYRCWFRLISNVRLQSRSHPFRESSELMMCCVAIERRMKWPVHTLHRRASN